MDPHISELSARLESEHWWFEGRGSVLAGVTDRLLPGAGLVVEVGCGTGGVLSRLPDRLERVGIDPSERAIELARSLHPGAEFRVGLAPEGVSDRLPDADLVLFCDVLEHIDDDVGTLAGVVDEMRPGARVLITVPADMSLWSPHDVAHGHVRRYEAADLARFWTGMPIQHLLTTPFNWKLQPLARLVRWSSRTLGRTAGPEGTDLALPPRPLNGLMTRIFASELPRIAQALDGARPPVRRRGVSWMVVLERRS